MNVRQANTADDEAIRRVARASLEASYGFLDAAVIDAAIERWYATEALEDALADPDAVFLLVEDDETGEVVAFSESILVHRDRTTGEIDWLHVAPSARRGGVGARLLDRTLEALQEMGADRIEGLVLAGNDVGQEFYAEQGFSEVGRRPVSIGTADFEEIVYRRTPQEGEATDLTATVETADGDVLYVAEDEAQRGSDGPFVPLYRSADREGRYGLLCGNCDSQDVVMDSMGRAECTECDNTLKPTRWDAVYL